MSDVLIVGAGLVGLAAAKSLADQGLNVALIDQHKPKAWAINAPYALRVSAISLRSQALFEALGVWDAICQSRAAPYEQMLVWDAISKAHISFDAAEFAQPHLGHIIENDVVSGALWGAVEAHPQIEFVESKPTEITFSGDAWTLVLSNKKRTAPLLLACDGANSWVRESVGLSTDRTHYDQKALVAVVRSEKSHQQTAYQRFLPTGPLAFLPLGQSHLSSIVWTMPTESADAYLAMPKLELARLLESAFEQTLGSLAFDSEVAAFPLTHHHAPGYVLGGLALLGDAAHGIHPLAGQGANLGFADVAELSHVIQLARDKGRRYFALSTLAQYERARRRDNELMRQSMTGFNALFSNNKPSLVGLRGAGLNLVSSQAWLKQLFVRKAI